MEKSKPHTDGRHHSLSLGRLRKLPENYCTALVTHIWQDLFHNFLCTSPLNTKAQTVFGYGSYRPLLYKKFQYLLAPKREKWDVKIPSCMPPELQRSLWLTIPYKPLKLSENALTRFLLAYFLYSFSIKAYIVVKNTRAKSSYYGMLLHLKT